MTEKTVASGAAAPDPWHGLSRFTPARIGLGRAGGSLPTRELLRFGLAHARARDAVHLPFDSAGLASAIAALGFETIDVCSDAPSRDVYLRRPDLGRRLSASSRTLLEDRAAAAADLAVVVADGLSAAAVHAHAAAVLAALRPHLARTGHSVAPVAVATGARVALGDPVGALLKARAVLVLVGERPGLSSPDSLGAYLTFDPKVGRTDAERNCISNIRHEGLAPAAAAHKLAWLLSQAFARGLTGVGLKDESGDPALDAPDAPNALPPPRPETTPRN